jgi:hypothetical protein
VIRISAALVVLAIALLAFGAVTANLPFVYAAIGVSVLAMILLGLGVFLQRDLLRKGERGPAGDERAGESGEEPEPVASPSAARSGAGSSVTTSSPVPGSAAVSGHAPAPAGSSPQAAAEMGEPAPGNGRERSSSAAGEDGPDGELVQVVPGRRRYHRPGCAFLARRVTEELTIDEAREEGFSACTTCFPVDLAAEPEEPAVRGSADDEPAELAEAEPAEAGPAEAGPAEAGPAEAAPAEAAPPGAAASEAEPAGTKPAEAGQAEAGQAEAAPAGAAASEAETPAAATEAVTPAVEAETQDRPPEPVTPAHGIALGEPVEAAAGPAPDGGTGDPAVAAAEHVPGGPGQAAGASGETVWVVRGVSRYHRSDCVLIGSVDEEDVDTMTQADAEAAGCTPCRACHVVEEPLAG